MATLKLEIDDDEFSYLASLLNVKVDLSQEKVIAIARENFDYDKLVEQYAQSLLVEQGTTYSGNPYVQLSPLVRNTISEYLKEAIKTAVGNYIRTQDHTIYKLIDGEVQKHIKTGIEHGIERYAKDTAERLAKAMTTLAENIKGP